ncbi:TipAS antibiotic-recognition domain-containing protein [Streptomyces sp. NPDC002132]|uniref:TipAS antibiotic-recognition domain-containing protein n=1 Tax=unclassified Streptomyces TaxID=2593676 RepID=UPI00332A7255
MSDYNDAFEMSPVPAPGPDAVAPELFRGICEVFASYFRLTRQMQVCLARMYEADPGFAAHYDGVRAGLAAWFRQIVDASARAHGIDPDTATWDQGLQTALRRPPPASSANTLGQ